MLICKQLASCLGFALLCVGPWAHAEAPKSVNFQVDTLHPGVEVNRQVTAGFNFGNWMNMAEFGQVMSANVPPATLRFPGGNVGDDQDMNEPVLDLFATNLKLLHAENIPVIIQTRTFPGRGSSVPKNRPEDAATAARLAAERKINVAYWQVGNEPDLYPVTRGDPSWTAEHYCEVFRAQAMAIKAVDPSAKFAGPGVSGAVPAASDYLKTFVKHCGDVVDMLTWHIYPTDGTGAEESALAKISEPEYWLAEYRKNWEDPAKNPLGYQRKIEFGMTEYGLSWSTNKSNLLADMPAAMFAVETALRMARAGMHAAYYFAYQGVGFHGLLDQDGFPRPSYYGFRMIHDLKGHFVELACNDKEVWANAVQDGNKLNLIVMNTSKEERSLSLMMPGWIFVKGQWFDVGVVENESPVVALESATSARIPGRSMARLEFVATP
ncbi:GH39 family glycosyl hydrolase [Uliginosibacterium gangwonense]|uniref:GH39 family glycosyl hydrolase n=1 Tax=Uliginosibacterium gangwonense TaxID=392736 RepID=UPI000367F9F4|nr:hypothetical protein [Uliginosibacterium gangwonense]